MVMQTVKDANDRLSRAQARLSEFFCMESKEVDEANAQEWEKIVESAQLERRKAMQNLAEALPEWDIAFPLLAKEIYTTTQDVAYTLDNLDATRHKGVGC